MANKIVRIGVDFDGVLVYNPFRVGRSIVAFIKEKLLRVKKLEFFVPKNKLTRLAWYLLHESSVFPAKGVGLLKKMSHSPKFEFHLISARFSFLDGQLLNWLNYWGFSQIFKSVNINTNDIQPHLHKEKVIKKLKLDYYIEDNWDIVNYLGGKAQAKIYWIYNILDRRIAYKHKFPYLEKALRQIIFDR